jgi:hypothetical protein
MHTRRTTHPWQQVQEQWIPGTTCTACGRSGASGTCVPSGAASPPFDLSAAVGGYESQSVPFGVVQLTAAAAASTSTGSGGRDAGGAAGGLTMSAGPLDHAVLRFSNTSQVVKGSCAEVATQLMVRAGVCWRWRRLRRAL